LTTFIQFSGLFPQYFSKIPPEGSLFFKKMRLSFFWAEFFSSSVFFKRSKKIPELDQTVFFPHHTAHFEDFNQSEKNTDFKSNELSFS